VLLGGAEGDPGFEDAREIQTHAVAAGPEDADANTEVSAFVQLPEGKTCPYCTLQFMWAARSDGGYYVQCADISITDSGLPQDFNGLPSEAGNALALNNPSTGSGCSAGARSPAQRRAAAAQSRTAGIVAAIIVLIVVAVGASFYFRKVKGGNASPAAGGPRGTTVAITSGGLPAGWREQVDPASGRTYYVSNSGETSWTRPGGAPAPPAGQPAGGGGLPAGWIANTDPASGRQYYVNQQTGQTSWTVPTY
jgi:hypothetical protein